MADSHVSDLVLMGGDPELGARSAPMPSTFHNSAVAIEADEAIPKSRTGLLAGILAAALVAGGVAAFLVVRAGSSERPVQPAVNNPAPAPVPAPAPAPTPPVAPPLPAKVTIKFRSQPVGAAVARKDTGEQLGVTPFEIEVPQGKSPLGVVFKKANFKDVPLSIVPSESGLLAATLEAAPTTGHPRPPTRPERPVTRGKGHRPMDEDGVLAPSF